LLVTRAPAIKSRTVQDAVATAKRWTPSGTLAMGIRFFVSSGMFSRKVP
jgi:hypothetical protein